MASQITGNSTVCVNHLFSLTIKVNVKARVTGPSWGTHQWPVDFAHKGPVRQITFPYHDVIILSSSPSALSSLPKDDVYGFGFGFLVYLCLKKVRPVLPHRHKTINQINFDLVYYHRILIVARLSKSLATLTLGSSKINQHCWRFHGSGVIAAPQIIGLISFCTGMHNEYFFLGRQCAFVFPIYVRKYRK